MAQPDPHEACRPGSCPCNPIAPRRHCDTCGLSHREVCPSGPGVADVLSAPVPERHDPPCSGDAEPTLTNAPGQLRFSFGAALR